MDPSFEWVHGTIVSKSMGRQRIEVGQVWRYFAVLVVDVVAVSPEGEVVLRPLDSATAELLFPEVETTFKDKPVRMRACPFKWVDEREAKASKGLYKAGDLLAHEAWNVWSSMERR